MKKEEYHQGDETRETNIKNIFQILKDAFVIKELKPTSLIIKLSVINLVL